MPSCMALTKAGKTCQGRAMSNGLCSAHDPSIPKGTGGRPPRPIPLDELRRRYEAGETLRELGDEIGMAEKTLWHRFRKAGIQLRRTGPRPGHCSNRHQFLKTDEIWRLWEQGQSAPQIADHFGVAKSTIYKRLWEKYGDPEERRLRNLYEVEEVTLAEIRARLGIGWDALYARLRSYGIKRKGKVETVRDEKPTAQTVSLRALERASKFRKRKRRKPQPGMSTRQLDLLDILYAAPAPLSTGRIANVAKRMPRQWKGTHVCDIHPVLRSLESRALVNSVETVNQEWWYQRGRKVFVWVPAEDRAPQSVEEAEQRRELQLLIEQQETESRTGEWSDSEKGHWADRSIDAPITEDGFTILDTLGDEDENLAELMEEAA